MASVGKRGNREHRFGDAYKMQNEMLSNVVDEQVDSAVENQTWFVINLHLQSIVSLCMRQKYGEANGSLFTDCVQMIKYSNRRKQNQNCLSQLLTTMKTDGSACLY